MTSYHRDAIGRADSVTTPISASLRRSQTTRYDIMDRVMATHDIGPAVAYTIGAISGTAPAVTLIDTLQYDAEGNLLASTRRSDPNLVNIGVLTVSSSYDELHRKISATDAHNGIDHWHFDLAGNDTLWVTRRGDAVRTRFDALNRQTVRTTPSASTRR